MTSLFPMFVKLKGRRCLVVGAGRVAQDKIEALLRCGAEVLVVAPRAERRIAAWAARGRLRWDKRRFAPSDLDGAFLAIAATSLPQVNQAVFEQASARDILCNAVDQPAHCHFYFPAVVRRGRLQIAISSGGRSPSLTRRLRLELEEQFGPEYGAWLEWLGAERQRVLAREPDPALRRRLLARMASRSSFDRFVRRSSGDAA
jgi:precorrin-2 dehydrogenase